MLTMKMPTDHKHEPSNAADVGKVSGVKTLIVDLSHGFGGASSRVLTLMQNMSREKVALAALYNSPIARDAKQAGLSVFVMGKYKYDPLILKRLISLIKSESFQVVDTQNPQSKFWGSLAALFTRTALVSTLNSWYGDEHGRNSFRGFFYSWLELGTNFSKARYIVVSKAIYNALVKRKINPENISLIYNAVDVRVENIVSSRVSILNKYRLPPNAVLLVAVGRLVWAKGYDDLIAAFQLIVKAHPNLYCLIAGDGNLFTQLSTQINNAGLNDRILLLGHVSRNEALSLIKACDIFVMTSKSEGTPMVLLEAASLKKPIIAPKVGGIEELLVNGGECVLVSPGDHQGYVQGIDRLLTDKELSQRISEAAYLRVARDFTVDKQIRAVNSAYAAAWIDRSLV